MRIANARWACVAAARSLNVAAVHPAAHAHANRSRARPRRTGTACRGAGNLRAPRRAGVPAGSLVAGAGAGIAAGGNGSEDTGGGAGAATTVNVHLAGVASTLPAASAARTAKV